MNVEDCYQELGLAPGATDAQVKAAWRRLAARWHPDRNDSPQALARIQRINRALDEIRKARGEGGFGGTPEAREGGGSGGKGETGEAPEAAAEEEAASPGQVVAHDIDLTLEEVLTGCLREVRGEVHEDCADCEGSGLQAPLACSECGGSGQVRQHLWFSWVPTHAECEACGGQGTTRPACAACDGSGQAPARKYRCRAQIPPGARAGDSFDVAARVQGHRHKHQLTLRLRVRIAPHDLFSVEDDGTVRCELPVDGFAWMANRWIEVPTPRGPQQMKLQRGSLSYRIKGAGLPWQEDAAADCIVTVLPEFPQEWTPQQEAAIDRLVAGNTGAPGTPAGARMAAWNRRVEAWAASLPAKANPRR